MLDFEGVIRLHSGDLKKALESVVSDRNNLVRHSSCKQKSISNDNLALSKYPALEAY